mmetsp:Transcript_7412/g.18157  ORF Transcript_7412/g.18157 Transcript_7412/m.18157 type:complete len:335 (+) Transcript_7412:272-1276(+)
MTSWFTQSTGYDLSSAFDSLTETVQSVTEQVSEAIPTEHKEFLAKITLNTDEMISERQNFREEAVRKADAKDRLNKILPWETLDPEREILVEECKEAILELSGREETFFGPYEMPLLKVVLENSKEEEGAEAQPEDATTSQARRHMTPSEESLEMLSKLEPLPTLLEDFDLDAHVGLIQRLLKEDPKLVAMQASFSGGGLREKTFWRNYFFHCAFSRYEAGLSLDEIWSYGEESANTANNEETTKDNPSSDGGTGDVAETDNLELVEESGTTAPPLDAMVDLNDPATTNESLTELSELSPKNGFELIEDEDIDIAGDPELDELEAEIARELEGL